MNPQIFRAYDIRGIYNKDFNREDAQLIGQAFGTYIGERFGPKIVIGHDNRFSSDEINSYLIRGLIASGCEVTDIGLSLTPIVHFSVIKYQFDGGVIVTASHNPKEFNGFRFDGQHAVPIFNEELKKIWQIAASGRVKTVAQNEQKSVRYWNVFEDYLSEFRQRIHLQRKLKIVIDCGNGASSTFAQHVFETIGCEVLPLYCNLDGDFPYHIADPEDKLNMMDGAKIVQREKADLGLAFDTDADRFGVIDEKGQVYENDKILIILAKDLLSRHPGTKVLYDVKSSFVLPQEIKKAGGVPVMIQTGHPYFRDLMRKDPQILLGGEVSSHTFIKDNYYGFDDGLMAAARVCEILSNVNHPFSEFFKEIPKTAHTQELKAPCPDDKKFEVEEKIRQDFIGNWEVITLDGVRVQFSKTAWALIRASNTSPYLSLRFEAENKEKLDEIIEIVTARLEKYPVVDIGCLKNLQERHID